MTEGPAAPRRHRPTGVAPPPWIANLPTDHRGFHVPAEAGWDGDMPLLSVVETTRKTLLILRRACAICGHHLAPGRPVYRAFGQYDAAQIRGYERRSTQDLGGPLHRSCILYSAMICPYLRERTSRLAKDNTVTPGGKRGTRAAVMGFRSMSLLIYAGPHAFLSPDAPPPHAGYMELCDDIRYRDGLELADHLSAAVEQDHQHIDVNAERSFWTDVDTMDVAREAQSHFAKLNGSRADYQMIIAPHRYVGFVQ